MPRPAALLLVLLALFLPSPAAHAQDALAPDPPDVYIDCESWLCDFDYFRTEIPFVDYVRDRQDAEVHVLVTTQSTGAGGTAFTLSFIGQGGFVGVDDELGYTSAPTATEDEVRAGLARAIQAGLVRYLARTPMLDRLGIVYTASEGASTAPAQAEADPWNHWVFTTSVSGFGNGESTYRHLRLFGSASANRTTEAWKTSASVNTSRSSQAFELSDGSEVQNVQENYGASTLVVKSLTDHWSAGFRASASRSTQRNIDLEASFAPAVEYNVFPYAASTRKMLTFQYALGPTYANYADSTIYDELQEVRLQHALSAGVRARQPWGSVGVSAAALQFLHDLEKFNLDLGGNAEVRLVRGLSVSLGGNVEFIRAQLYLPKGDATDEDVLLRRRQLATSWRYFLNFGISYRFGSKFNNVVNPRFTGGSGSVIYFF